MKTTINISHIQIDRLNPFLASSAPQGIALASGDNILGIYESKSRGVHRLLKYNDGAEIIRNEDWVGFLRDLQCFASTLAR